MTFKQFVSTRRAHDNPRGDFIRDILRDTEFPEAGDLEGYLIGRGACREALAEFRKLYKQYMDSTQDQR